MDHSGACNFLKLSASDRFAEVFFNFSKDADGRPVGWSKEPTPVKDVYAVRETRAVDGGAFLEAVRRQSAFVFLKYPSRS